MKKICLGIVALIALLLSSLLVACSGFFSSSTSQSRTASPQVPSTPTSHSSVSGTTTPPSGGSNRKQANGSPVPPTSGSGGNQGNNSPTPSTGGSGGNQGNSSPTATSDLGSTKVQGPGDHTDLANPNSFYLSENGVDNFKVYTKGYNWVRNVFFDNSTDAPISWSVSAQSNWISFTPSSGEVPAHTSDSEARRQGYGTHIVASNDNANLSLDQQIEGDVMLTLNGDSSKPIRLYALYITVVRPTVTMMTLDSTGTNLTMEGTDLDWVETVKIGQQSATITSLSANQITVSLPAGSGTVEVYLEMHCNGMFSDEQCVDIDAGSFTYPATITPIDTSTVTPADTSTPMPTDTSTPISTDTSTPTN